MHNPIYSVALSYGIFVSPPRQDAKLFDSNRAACPDVTVRYCFYYVSDVSIFSLRVARDLRDVHRKIISTGKRMNDGIV